MNIEQLLAVTDKDDVLFVKRILTPEFAPFVIYSADDLELVTGRDSYFEQDIAKWRPVEIATENSSYYLHHGGDTPTSGVMVNILKKANAEKKAPFVWNHKRRIFSVVNNVEKNFVEDYNPDDFVKYLELIGKEKDIKVQGIKVVRFVAYGWSQQKEYFNLVKGENKQ